MKKTVMALQTARQKSKLPMAVFAHNTNPWFVLIKVYSTEVASWMTKQTLSCFSKVWFVSQQLMSHPFVGW